MDAESRPFRVAVKEGATEANEAVAQFAAAGEVVGFDSAVAARERADRLSEAGETPVAVQAAASNDPADVDAYLVARPERRHYDPDGTPAEGLTFDTGANQYGALGEAVVLTPEVNPPVLTHFARVDLDVGERAGAGETAPERGDLRVELDADPEPVVVGSGRRWEPDCRAVVRPGPDRPVVAEYWCEVKAGDGSFERSQREAMQALAREATVLTVRVDLDDLPDSYTARIRRVEPGESGDAGEGNSSAETVRVNSTLDDF